MIPTIPVHGTTRRNLNAGNNRIATKKNKHRQLPIPRHNVLFKETSPGRNTTRPRNAKPIQRNRNHTRQTRKRNKRQNSKGSEKTMSYFDLEEFCKVVVLVTVAALFVIVVANYFDLNIVKTVDYTSIQENKIVAGLEQQLENKNTKIAELELMQPPKPTDYSLAIILVGCFGGLFAFLGFLHWSDLKEKELKILQETKEAKKK